MDDDVNAVRRARPGLLKVVRASAQYPGRLVRSRLRTRTGNSTSTPVPVDVADVLRRVRDLPLSTWSYDFDHTSVKHMGPMAQDFAASFGLGDSTRQIHTVDTAGVSLAAIQALADRLDDIEARLSELERVRVAPATDDE